ncbi:alpha-galactosidase [Longispora fulva]|uniref:Alpha-galactosidase n=1 Tax=Longispora fulva TaxID=619741 RepID=A0A8J7KJC1_9ACTN|nr:NPCBM/NEW2 domain-containing protein [Longispora fulva]MBG6136759.1 alpha-galactosidase [Longispora fulva]GIG59930.1 alpha-galactosidase [Longispora fulva]
MSAPLPRRSLAAGVAALFLAAVSVAGTAPAVASDNGLALTPQMGWNSWNAFHCSIDETKIKGAADALVSTGLSAAGYTYVNVDDCWQAGTRDANGRLQADPTRFPAGIKALADYVHGKGLKFGIYATPGTRTCGNIYNGYPGALGSKGHEALDARTFADWGVDYLKYDWCLANEDGVDPQAGFTLMRDSLKDAGRPILYSIHREPQLPVDSWRADVANSWRTTPDIGDSWGSMIGIAHANQPLAGYARPGAWNDPDMLEVGNGGMTATEYRTHMSLWAEMAAPLLVGTNLATASSSTVGILTNADVLAVSQDTLGKQGTVVSSSGGLVVMSRPLADGSRAVTLTNETGSTATIATTASALGIGGSSSYTLKDLWSKATTRTVGSVSASVPSHATVMYRVTPAAGSTVYLSDLQPTSSTNGWGPVEKDTSVGEAAAGDGHTLTVNGTTYAKGLGAHAASDVRYALGSGCTTVTADVGVDDEKTTAGSVVFQIWKDTTKVADSGVKTYTQAATHLTADVTGGSTLRLVVTDAGDGVGSDHADWGNAQLTCGTGTGSAPVSVEAEKGTRGGAATAPNCSACSGGAKVGFLGNGAGNDVTLSVTVPAAGTRQLGVAYLTSGARSFSVSVNGGAAIQLTLDGSSWDIPLNSALVDVALNAGANTIRFYNASGPAPDLDMITVF